MTMNEIFEEYAHEYIEHFGDLIPFEHRKVIDAIINCRTQYCGAMIYQCEACGQTTSFIDHAAIGIVLIANTIKPISG